MVVALAVGLGSVDTPVPAVAEWEWLNWKFPRPIHAGDTVYAHWMLTQKRPPSSGSPTSIVVWRVDVHTADGALCAEGEIGAKVVRSQAPKRVAEPPAPPAARAGRRRRRPRANGTTPSVPEPPPVAAPPAAAAKPERAAGPSRRRRRRRPSGSGAAREEEHEPRAAHVTEIAAASPEPPPPPARAPERQPASAGRKGLGGVLRRLRGS
ncbi:MAG TPA: hypothetical protein VFL27_07680 [Candidatus Dormibacteraeota bacterium]|nr:hypothetical protein [Candidatus Dormibacteraeota bacterium]